MFFVILFISYRMLTSILYLLSPARSLFVVFLGIILEYVCDGLILEIIVYCLAGSLWGTCSVFLFVLSFCFVLLVF